MENESVDPAVCPLCGEPNGCEAVEGRDSCWCFEIEISSEALERIPEEARGVACLCRVCATAPT